MRIMGKRQIGELEPVVIPVCSEVLISGAMLKSVLEKSKMAAEEAAEVWEKRGGYTQTVLRHSEMDGICSLLSELLRRPAPKTRAAQMALPERLKQDSRCCRMWKM